MAEIEPGNAMITLRGTLFREDDSGSPPKAAIAANADESVIRRTFAYVHPLP